MVLFLWWAGMDSNHRTRMRTDLQSAAFSHSAICPNAERLLIIHFDFFFVNFLIGTVVVRIQHIDAVFIAARQRSALYHTFGKRNNRNADTFHFKQGKALFLLIFLLIPETVSASRLLCW